MGKRVMFLVLTCKSLETNAMVVSWNGFRLDVFHKNPQRLVNTNRIAKRPGIASRWYLFSCAV